MATYCVSYSIATALISQDDSGLSESEVTTLDKWLQLHNAENARWKSIYPVGEGYTNEGIDSYCEVLEQFCLCDEITTEAKID